MKGLLFARARGLDRGLGKANDEKSPRTLDHEVAITEFHLRLRRQCEEFGFDLYWRQRDLKRTVNPDALFAITNQRLPEGRNTYYYFLEIERSKQGSYRDGESGLIRKLQRYAEYQGSERCLRDWRHFTHFRVAVVVGSHERADNLLRALRRTYPSKMVWVSPGGLEFRTPKDWDQGITYSLIRPDGPRRAGAAWGSTGFLEKKGEKE